MPKSKVVPQFKVGDVINLRRIPQEVHHIPRWTKYEVMSLTARSYVVATVGADSRRWHQEHKIPLTLNGWQVGSDEDVALTEFILEERYRIAQVLEWSWDEGLIYHVALTLEKESKQLQEKLEKFRRHNEQRQSTSSVSTDIGSVEAADVNGASKA